MTIHVHTAKPLSVAVAERPYTEFSEWWSVGDHFLTFMAEAIGSQWKEVVGAENGSEQRVQALVEEYIQLVYQRTARENLVHNFLAKHDLATIQSGEFDALSYAFYRSAFERFAAQFTTADELNLARRGFTQRVGRLFYRQLHDHLRLTLPNQIQSEDDLGQLQNAISSVGGFLTQEGYLRDHFAFRFDVQQEYKGQNLAQSMDDVVQKFQEGQCVYALYEMGYPIILPSAVYLYQTIGEAQHHSSRTIEELFGRIGYMASETADFDPSGYSSDLVVELWEIYTQ